MDKPFTVAEPDAPNSLQLWTVTANDAATLESKLAKLIAGLVSTQAGIVIRGFDIGAAGDGGLFQAAVTGVQTGSGSDDLQVAVGDAIFFALDTNGDGDLIPFATGDAEFAPSGERLQKRIFDTGGGPFKLYGLKSAGCNAGRRLMLLALVARPTEQE